VHPRRWTGFEIAYRHGRTLYRIDVQNPKRVCRGCPVSVSTERRFRGKGWSLVDDGREHQVQVVLG